VRLEIRPAFDEAVRTAERPIRLAAARMIVLPQAIDLPRLRIHRGLHFEKLHGMIEPVTGGQLFSYRLLWPVRTHTM
jgi:hypothetical protein